jgi:hypothetical protein
MSVEYDLYLKEHKENVIKGFEWIKENLPGLVCEELYICEELIRNHDGSKMETKEYAAYDAYFYGGNRSFKVVEEFNIAWLRHIHYNPHHWQHWVLISDEEDEGVNALEMPYKYIIEMICDWWAFGWRSGELYDIFTCYSERKSHIMFHPDTRKKVESILSTIKAKLKRSGDEQ